MTQRWTRRPAGSNWGEFGGDDQLGRLNLITPECRRKAALEIQTGRSFCLSLPLDVPRAPLSPHRRAPQQSFVRRREGRPSVNYPLQLENEAYTDVVCDDHFTVFSQYSTQWDSLAHVGQHFDADDDGSREIVYYNGYRGGIDIVGPEKGSTDVGALALGVDTMARTGVQGRGVMVDLLPEWRQRPGLVGYDTLMQALEATGAMVESGDILCLHTGYAGALLDTAQSAAAVDNDHHWPALDGRDARLLRWLADSGIAALVADNVAIEAYPNPPSDGDRYPGLPLHETCLFKLGMPLGELWYLTELNDWLREQNRSRFFLTAPPLRLPRAFGSPVTPVATV